MIRGTIALERLKSQDIAEHERLLVMMRIQSRQSVVVSFSPPFTTQPTFLRNKKRDGRGDTSVADGD